LNAFEYGDPMRTLTNLIIWLGMLIVVPAGLRLIGGGPVRRVAGHWYWGAVPGAVALWLPRGPVAAALAAAYAALTLLLAAAAPARLAGRRPTAAAPARLAGHRPTAVDVAVGTALAAPSVAAVALVAERAGYALFGICFAGRSLFESWNGQPKAAHVSWMAAWRPMTEMTRQIAKTTRATPPP